MSTIQGSWPHIGQLDIAIAAPRQEQTFGLSDITTKLDIQSKSSLSTSAFLEELMTAPCQYVEDSEA